MARVVRKVSNKAVQNQKKNNILHNKIFWIIISVVLVIGVAVVIVTTIIYSISYKSFRMLVSRFVNILRRKRENRKA